MANRSHLGSALRRRDAEGDASARFIYYYNGVADILVENQEDPGKAEGLLADFMEKYQEDYIKVTKEVNALPGEGKKEFMAQYQEQLSQAMDKYWDTAFTPAGESEAVVKHLEAIPLFDVMAFNEYFQE